MTSAALVKHLSFKHPPQHRLWGAAGRQQRPEEPALLFTRERPVLPLDVSGDGFQGGKSFVSLLSSLFPSSLGIHLSRI